MSEKGYRVSPGTFGRQTGALSQTVREVQPVPVIEASEAQRAGV